MLTSKLRHGALRHLSSSSCAATYRVDPITFTCARASTSNNNSKPFTLPFRFHTDSILSSISSRYYATKPASRPKAHTGRATTTRSRKTSGANTRAKPAKSTKRAAKPKRKTKTKSRAKAKKPQRRAKARRALTPKQKEAAAKKKERATVRELKATALKPPKRLPSTAYTIISSEKSKESKGLATKEASAKYKQLVPEEREHYNHLANENKTKNEAAYKTWVESIPAEDIRKANLARRRLKRMGIKGYHNSIQDSRQVKRPVNARLVFLKERFNSGDMAGLKLPEAQRLIGQEWSALPQNQKQRFFQAELASRDQYVKDVKNIYHRDIVLNGNSLAAQALHA